MKKFFLQLLGLVIIIFGATFLVFNYKYLLPITSQFVKNNRPTPVASTSLKTLKIVGSDGTEKTSLNIEIADTDAKRSKGLGFRDSLATNSGMLFNHDTPKKYTYWMKGMRFPIDFIWIMDDQIVDIKPNVPVPITGQTDETLEVYGPKTEINRVLETNAGYTITNNIQIGDKIIVAP